MTEVGHKAAEVWAQRLRSGEQVHTGRPHTMLALLLAWSAALLGTLLWVWFGGRATISIGFAVALPFLWLNYLFAEIRFTDGYLEYRDWLLQPRRRRVDCTFLAALAWRPTGRRGSPDLFLCYSASGLGDDLKWVPLSTDFWPPGLREAVQQEIVRRCGLTESTSAAPDDILWRRPGDTRQLP